MKNGFDAIMLAWKSKRVMRNPLLPPISRVEMLEPQIRKQPKISRRDFMVGAAVAAVLSTLPATEAWAQTDSIGATGRTYATIALWIASIPGTLTQNLIGECYNDSLFVITSSLSIASITSGSFSITLQPHAGQGFSTSAAALTFNQSNGVAVQGALATTPLLVINGVANVTIQGIQWQNTIGNGVGGGAGHVIQVTGAAANCNVNGNLQDFSAPSTSGPLSNDSIMSYESSSAGGLVFNNLFLTSGGISSKGIWFGNLSVSTTFAYNTIVTPSNKTSSAAAAQFGNYATNGVLKFENNAMFGFALSFGFSGHTLAAGSDYNASDQAVTGLGAHSIGSLTYASQFRGVTTTGGLDYRLATSGSSLVDAGIADTGVTTVDIFGTTRPQGSAPDIGAHELVSAGPSIFIPPTPLGLGPG